MACCLETVFIFMLCFLKIRSCKYGSLLEIQPKSPNVSVPSNQTFNCTILGDSSNYTSRDIVFYQGKELVDEVYSKVLDNRTKQLVYPFLIPTHGNGQNIICHIPGDDCYSDHCNVLADYPPEVPVITNVDILNWNAIKINWTSRNAYIFEIKWHVSLVKSDKSLANYCSHVEHFEILDGKGKWMCIINFDFLTDIRNEVYQIIIEGSSELGQVAVESDHYAVEDIVVPGRVSELKITNISKYSIELHWAPPAKVKSPSILSVDYQIVYQSQYGQTKELVTDEHSVTLKDLIPYTQYHITVYTKHQLNDRRSIDGASVNKTTRVDVPGQLPMVTDGSYEMLSVNDDKQDILFHWKNIPAQYKHGVLQFCQIVIDQGEERHIVNPEVSSFKVTDLPLSFLQAFISCNTSVGGNEALFKNPPAHIKVANKDEIPIVPSNITVYGNSSDSSVLIAWPVTDDLHHTNVTVYYCKGKEETCQEELHWKTIAAENADTLVVLPPGGNLWHYIYAVSVDSAAGSSGMKWVDCVFDTNRELIQTLSLNVTSKNDKSLAVYFDFGEQSHCGIKDVILQWCANSKSDCQEKALGTESKTHEITGLYSSTCYDVSVRWLAYGGKKSKAIKTLSCTEKSRDWVVPVIVVISIFLGCFTIAGIFGICSDMRRKFKDWLYVKIGILKEVQIDNIATDEPISEHDGEDEEDPEREPLQEHQITESSVNHFVVEERPDYPDVAPAVWVSAQRQRPPSPPLHSQSIQIRSPGCNSFPDDGYCKEARSVTSGSDFSSSDRSENSGSSTLITSGSSGSSSGTSSCSSDSSAPGSGLSSQPMDSIQENDILIAPIQNKNIAKPQLASQKEAFTSLFENLRNETNAPEEEEKKPSLQETFQCERPQVTALAPQTKPATWPNTLGTPESNSIIRQALEEKPVVKGNKPLKPKSSLNTGRPVKPETVELGNIEGAKIKNNDRYEESNDYL